MEKAELVKYAQLDLLLELDRICKENGINYFLVGGTLIGAIRHNGFIPWDDDIDVGMLRNDYEKFEKACDKCLNSEYAKYDWHIDTASPLPFLKLKIKGTHYREYLSKESSMNDAIYIDVFPYDNAPNSKLQKRIQEFQNYFVKKILLLRCGFTIDRGNRGKRLLYFSLNVLSKIRSVEKWKECLERIQKRYNQKKTVDVVSLSGSYAYRKELKSRELVTKLTTHQFEGYDLSVPKDYDRFLREVYGDYMKLPPEDQRVSRHGISLIDLGNYKIRCKIT